MGISSTAFVRAKPLKARQLGNYRLLRLIGSGGFASVYLGEALHTGTQVAIKVVATPRTATGLQQLYKETRILPCLEHPHIVRVLDFELNEHNPFLVLEYAPRGTFRQRDPFDSRLPLHMVISYVKQCASALQYIHDLGLIHRDIKPENLLLMNNDRLVLCDFGIAVVPDENKTVLDKVGTASYMAPEQICGRPCAASDQYALAAMTYEWLCGTPPFTGETSLALVKQHLFATPPALGSRVRHFPVAVENVLQQALAKAPHERFHSVEEFAATLEAASMVHMI